MNPFGVKFPDGLAEYILFIIAVLFLVFLYYKDKFIGSKTIELSDADKARLKSEADSRCALASLRVEGITNIIQSNIEQRRKMEEDLSNVNKVLVKIVEDNTRAITMLCDRIRS